MVRTADALVLYHTAPHMDVFETGQRAAKLLRRILVDGARPVTAWQRIPAVVPAERANTQDPASVSHALRAMLVDMESRPKVLAAGLATVQPWLDVPQLASAAVVVSDGDEELARGLCAQVADAFWRKRRDYLPELTPLVDAVRIAHEEARRGLVVLSDSADATTSGAPGDSTAILNELLKYDWPRPALVALVSPEAVAAAERTGEGAALQLSLGGIRDTHDRLRLPCRSSASSMPSSCCPDI
jgi:microcystin degradation protein MlrC